MFSILSICNVTAFLFNNTDSQKKLSVLGVWTLLLDFAKRNWIEMKNHCRILLHMSSKVKKSRPWRFCCFFFFVILYHLLQFDFQFCFYIWFSSKNTFENICQSPNTENFFFCELVKLIYFDHQPMTMQSFIDIPEE